MAMLKGRICCKHNFEPLCLYI